MIDNGVRRDVAVKVLRPGIEKQFKRDLDSYFFAARQIERFHPPTRRLRPVAVVETLAHSVEIEMDMRLEAAAISEMADNIAKDQTPELGGFRVPDGRLAPHRAARADARMDRRHPDLRSRRARKPPATI